MRAPTTSSVINIGIVGGGPLCKELLDVTQFNYQLDSVQTPILAVADLADNDPAKAVAREMGLLIFDDYHTLYDPRYSIHLIIVLTQEQDVLMDILDTRPARIRILSYHVFKIFWDAIRQEERKLREQNTAMETILNGITDFILVISPDMEIIDVNEPFLTKMGLRREEVIGNKCYRVFNRLNSECDDPDFQCPLKRVVKDHRSACQVRTRVDKTGSERHFEVSVHPVWEKSGKISKFIHISRDITRRVKEEAEITRRLEQMVEERTRQLRETHEKLVHKDKMASMGKLSASVVHEINNPIAGVLNLTMLIKRMMDEGSFDDRDIEQYRQYLGLMETETRRVSRIISNLLTFARQSKIERKPVGINRLIEQTLILNGNLLRLYGIQVKKVLAADLPKIIGSADQLQQVVMNFVSNAAEAMEHSDGSRLTITTAYESDRDAVTVVFKDNGPGIPLEDQNRLFEPFFTTKKRGKGVGLGLSVAYGIVQEHGGSIHVASSPGKGTIFTIELPKTPPPDPEPGGIHGQHPHPDR